MRLPGWYTVSVVFAGGLGMGFTAGAIVAQNWPGDAVGRDASLGRDLRALAERGQAPMLQHSEHGWVVHLRCGREVAFRETAEQAAKDALEAAK